MKRLLIITALIAGTAIYLLSAAWAFEHMDLYLEPAPETKVGERLKGGRADDDNMDLYISLERTLDRELFDKNIGTSKEPDYYYVLEVEHTADMRL